MIDIERAPLGRRAFLTRGAGVLAGLAIPGALSACGGSSSGSSASSAASSPTGSAGGSSTKASGTLRMLSWEGYDIPQIAKPWLQEQGITFKSTYVSSNDEIGAKAFAAKQSGTPIDFITYNQGYREQFGELGILKPIDVSRIPNYANLFDFFKSKEGNFWVDADGTVRGVPFAFGWSDGITYDSSATSEPASYDVLFDPKSKGKVAITDDPVTIYQGAAHVLGYDPAKLDAAQFAKAEEWIGALLKQTAGVSPTYGDMVTKLVSGDAVFAFPGWPAMDVFASDAGKSTIKTILPPGGGSSFCDAIGIPPSVGNEDAVYAWINFICDPKTAAAAATFLVGGTPIQKAAPLLPAKITTGYGYPEVTTLFKRSPLYPNPPLKSSEFATLKQFNASWTKLKAGAS